MQPIDRVVGTVIYVGDLDAAERFYGEVLGLELDSRKDGIFVFFRCGEGMLLPHARRGAPASSLNATEPGARSGSWL